MSNTLFNQAYSRDSFLPFINKRFVAFKELASEITIDNNDVKDFLHLGNVTTSDDKQLALFEITIKSNTQLARNRVGLRNIVLRQIGQSVSDGAIAVYIDLENKQWRLSFISITPKFNANGKLIIEKTASKRYTYLLGENTQTRTANERLSQINKRSTLAEITDVFAVEPLTKEFYDKLFKWYERAQKSVTFPNDENTKDHEKISLIRLLTRLLFIWFIKEKGLVSRDLFDKTKLSDIIKWEDSNYYKAILQNLFFATLNRPIKERSFRTTDKNGKANSNNYLVTNIYRYQNYFQNTDEENIIDLFKPTPFLNGGLFECLDHEATAEEKQQFDNDKTIRQERTAIRIDSFSDRTDNQLEIPNELFFNQDEQNLGLINLLNQYQFTAEESTTTDIDVALDPELLGKVFENLLAYYNPETQQQAKKATGSFYTPREIVSYMVDESLKQYLLQKTPPYDNDQAFYQQRLDDLFNIADKLETLPRNQEESLLYDEEIEPLIAALSQIKILDPAVGSGAFPMGALQKITSLLKILDPDNSRWKAQKIAELPELKSIEQDLKTTEKLNDQKAKVEAKRILEEKKQFIIEQFKAQDHDYLRKLYLIESCIYGVDIQIIAITIAKLRFFISLAIEQTPDNGADNLGIKPLPNLETKLITANSLLSLNNAINGDLFDKEITILRDKLAEVRKKYFTAKTTKTKRKYKNQDKEIRYQILEELKNSNSELELENAQKIADWDPYNQNAQADWFDAIWMFGVTDGFDIVIGNPPYIQIQKFKGKQEQTDWENQKYETFIKSADVYCLFYERGHQLLNNKGHLCYITSNKWMRAGYGEKTRSYFAERTNPIKLIDFGGYKVFEKATVDTNILLFQKNKPQQTELLACNIYDNFNAQTNLADYFENNKITLSHLSKESWIIADEQTLQLKAKIEKIGTPLKDWDINIYRGVLTGYNDAFIIDKAKRDELIAADPKNAEIIKPILRGKDINRYNYHFADLYLLFIPWHFPLHKNPAINGASKKAESEFKRQYLSIYNHLLQHKENLSKRNKDETGIRYEWYALQRCANTYYPEFEKEKIVFSRIVKKPQVFFDKEKCYTDTSAYIIVGNYLKYLLAFLNSNFVYKIFYKFYSGGGIDGEIKIAKIINLPIPQPTAAQDQQMTQLVDKILAAKQVNPTADTSKLEQKIDQRVYKLYDLTDEEIQLITNQP